MGQHSDVTVVGGRGGQHAVPAVVRAAEVELGLARQSLGDHRLALVQLTVSRLQKPRVARAGHRCVVYQIFNYL